MFSSLAIAVATIIANPATLAPPPTALRAADAFAAQLADPSFELREAATAGLAQLGRFALPALTAALQSPLAEVRGRAAVLYPSAAESERSARLASFLADNSLRYQHNVPGWQAFAVVAGNTESAKTLFAAAMADPDNVPLLSELDAGAANPELQRVLSLRRLEVQQNYVRVRNNEGRAKPPLLPTIATIIAAEILTRTEAPGNPSQEYPTGLFFSTVAGRQAILGDGEYGAAFARLTRQWMLSRTTSAGLGQAVAAANGAVLASTRAGGAVLATAGAGQTKPTIPFPVATLTELAGRYFVRIEVPITTRHTAWIALIRHRATDQLWALGPQLADEGDMIKPPPKSENPHVKGRDMALAAALVLTGQKPADYGFTDRNKLGQLTYQTYTFRDDPEKEPGARQADEKRQQAFAKWATWRAATRGSLGGALLATSPDPLTPPVAPPQK